MPCYDSRDDVRAEYTSGVDPVWKEEAIRLSKRNAMLTELLCMAGRAWFNKTEIPVEVLNWWKEHKALDAEHGVPW